MSKTTPMLLNDFKLSSEAALWSMHICAGSSEPPLLEHMIYLVLVVKILRAGSKFDPVYASRESSAVVNQMGF